MLQDVGVFLPQFYSTPRGRVMAHEVPSCFQVNLYVVWLFCDCGTVMDLVYEFPGPPRPIMASPN